MASDAIDSLSPPAVATNDAKAAARRRQSSGFRLSALRHPPLLGFWPLCRGPNFWDKTHRFCPVVFAVEPGSKGCAANRLGQKVASLGLRAQRARDKTAVAAIAVEKSICQRTRATECWGDYRSCGGVRLRLFLATRLVVRIETRRSRRIAEESGRDGGIQVSVLASVAGFARIQRKYQRRLQHS